MGYENVQDAAQWVVGVTSVVAMVAYSLVVAVVRSEDAPLWLSFLAIFSVTVIYLVVLTLTRLRVRVGPGSIDLKFRLGWPTKSIDRAAVTGVDRHRNSWLEGWGIRKVRRGWMWNVWGLDSVELRLDSGKVFRIGTDDVDGLIAAIRT